MKHTHTHIYIYIDIPYIYIYRHTLYIHIYCVGNLTIIGSDDSLAPTNAGIFLFEPYEQTSVKSEVKFVHLHSRKCIWKYRLWNDSNLSRPQCVKAGHVSSRTSLYVCMCVHLVLVLWFLYALNYHNSFEYQCRKPSKLTYLFMKYWMRFFSI